MDKVIEMLNADITGEIEAILTYLRHDFVLSDENCEISREMEEIARDEMRHLEWLSEMVVALGGVPTIEHAELHLEGEDLPAMLKRDVGLEQTAIKQYQDHIDAIPDPKVKHLLRKIMNEEVEHRDDFEEMLCEVLEEAEEQPEDSGDEEPDTTIGSMIDKKKTEGGE